MPAVASFSGTGDVTTASVACHTSPLQASAAPFILVPDACTNLNESPEDTELTVSLRRTISIVVPEGNILIGRAAACWPLDFGFRGCPRNAEQYELYTIIPQRVPKECLGTLLTSPSNLLGCVCLWFLVLD